jgi:Rha family phage regulatory protein
MKQLVEVQRGEVFCDSQMVAEKFGYKHFHVAKVIQKLIDEFSKIKTSQVSGLNIKEVEREYRGRTFKAYLMDRRSFSLLSMRFVGIKALEWQVKFNDAFYAMERQLLLESNNKNNATWITQREQGKLVRLVTTDTIKDFVEYAKAQGSQNAQFYYKHITETCYRCLQLVQAKRPKLRDTLDLFQLNQLMVAEVVADRSIRKHMSDGEHYKTIFTLVKQDLERFADGLMIPAIKQKPLVE